MSFSNYFYNSPPPPRPIVLSLQKIRNYRNVTYLTTQRQLLILGHFCFIFFIFFFFELLLYILSFLSITKLFPHVHVNVWYVFRWLRISSHDYLNQQFSFPMNSNYLMVRGLEPLSVRVCFLRTQECLPYWVD